MVEHCSLDGYSVLTRWPAPHRADGPIAATAASFDAELVTCDRRALPVYERYGARAVLIG